MKFDVRDDEVVGDGQDGPIEPLPAGTYNATIYDVKFKPFGPNSNNPGRPAYNVQFRIADGQKGANRRLFQLIGLFPTWSTGSDNFMVFRFLSAVTGKSEKAIRAAVKKDRSDFEVPDPKDLLGKPLTLVVGVEPDDYAYKQAVAQEAEDADLEGRAPEPLDREKYKRNTIKSFKPAADGAENEVAVDAEGFLSLEL